MPSKTSNNLTDSIENSSKGLICEPQTAEDDYSESSDDEGDEVKALYSKLPEDLGFTLVGINYHQNDLRILKRLKMDLDTFMTLSEQELLELGVKQSVNLKQLIEHSCDTDITKVESIFWKPRVKDLRLSSDEAVLVMKGISTHAVDLRRFLDEWRFIYSSSPPVNYVVGKNTTSRQLFETAATAALTRANAVLQQVITLGKEFKCDKGSVVKSSEQAPKDKLPEEKETIGESSVGKPQPSASSFGCLKTVVVVTTTAALVLAIWKIQKPVLCLS